MKRTVIIALGMVFAALSAAAPAASVYVADEDGRSLTIVDTNTGTTKAVQLSISPHNVDATPDGKLALAVGMAAKGTAASSGHGKAHDADHGDVGRGILELLRAGPDGLRAVARVGIDGDPSHVVPAPAGDRAYVTDSRNNTVLVVDIEKRAIVTRIAVGTYPHGLRLSPDGSHLAVANMKSDNVSLVDLSTGRIDTVAVGQRPVQVAFAPDGRRLFVTLNTEDKVAAIDLPSRQVLYKASVGRGPVQLAVTPDGARIVVANQGTKAAPDQRVTVLGAADGKLLGQIEVGRGAHGVAIESDGRIAYVTNTYGDSVSAVDIVARSELKRYPTGKEPNGLVVR